MIKLRQLELEFNYKEISSEYFKNSLEEFKKLGREDFSKEKTDKYLEIANIYLDLAKMITYQNVFVSNNRTVTFCFDYDGLKQKMKHKTAMQLVEKGVGYICK